MLVGLKRTVWVERERCVFLVGGRKGWRCEKKKEEKKKREPA